MVQQMIMPEMGENIASGSVTRVEVAVGDRVEEGQPLIEVESDKVSVKVPAVTGGIVQELLVGEGDTISPGDIFARISTAAPKTESAAVVQSAPAPETTTEENRETPTVPSATSQPTTQSGATRRAYAGPSAYRLARELDIALDLVTGTAEGGRISCNDIKAFARMEQSPDQPRSLSRLPDFSAITPVSRKALSSIARATADNMARAWENIPHAWLQIKLDITRLETTREGLKAKATDGKPPNVTAFIIKALAKTLETFPQFNACLDTVTHELVLKHEIHIGLAVDTPRGLLVPVIRHADRLSLEKLTGELQQLTEAGRTNRLRPEQLRSGGMTISTLGGMGIDSLFPIVNWPELAILGIGSIGIEPVWQQQQFVPRSMLTLVLGFDHRVINGADGARFLNYLKKLLEQPVLLALS